MMGLVVDLLQSAAIILIGAVYLLHLFLWHRPKKRTATLTGRGQDPGEE